MRSYAFRMQRRQSGAGSNKNKTRAEKTLHPQVTRSGPKHSYGFKPFPLLDDYILTSLGKQYPKFPKAT
ncbi:hypothetical protein QJS04_geneDACA021728 [Acorus gramineus]|uniref:Uncharacterized protein n=1 Tax=Acorus gramineus TaxID=55184 RepID=A0AAV9AJ88_ACOGR|nr:hypothetical protein QJS04_geneDACA021728 [Acorus gramineus]